MKTSASDVAFPPEQRLFTAAGGVPLGLAPVVAHQGGWDEILMVVAPLAVIGGLLWLANRRVTAQIQTQLENEANADDTGETPGPDAARGPLPSGDDGQA